MYAFYLDPNHWHRGLLEGSEFQHAVRVLRMKPQDTFLLYNGKGKEAICCITKIEKSYLFFETTEVKDFPQAENKVILAAAWTKAARRGFLIEKAVELGASALWLWKADYSQFPLPEENSATVQSWQAQLIAGMKQCHNPFLPNLALFNSIQELVSNAQLFEHKQVLTTDPAPHVLPYDFNALALQGTTLVVIGTEGGFSPKEIDIFAAANYSFYTMGNRILRYETAAILALGLHWWQKEIQCTEI